MATAKPAAKALPKTLAACADEMYRVRHERYALQKQVDELKARETALGEELINKLPKSQASGIAGKIANAKIESKTVYLAKDWDAIRAHILKNHKKQPGVWSLLQLRLGEAACKEMFEAGVKVPGVEREDIPRVSLTKV
jgi:hypothetical protein